MTNSEAMDFLQNGGYVDCGNDNDLKQQVLDLTEFLGFEVGFDRWMANDYRYVYYDNGCHKIHMMGNAFDSENTVPAVEFLCTAATELPEPSPLVDLYEWIT